QQHIGSLLLTPDGVALEEAALRLQEIGVQKRLGRSNAAIENHLLRKGHNVHELLLVLLAKEDLRPGDGVKWLNRSFMNDINFACRTVSHRKKMGSLEEWLTSHAAKSGAGVRNIDYSHKRNPTLDEVLEHEAAPAAETPVDDAELLQTILI